MPAMPASLLVGMVCRHFAGEIQQVVHLGFHGECPLSLDGQGVHIGEFHYLEDLARDNVHEFCYSAVTNAIVGTTAGFIMRPLALK